MEQYEFINILKMTLIEEIPEYLVREHIQYYEGYIEENIKRGKSWDDIQEELGEPRLIGKTLIDTYKVSKENGYHSTGYTHHGYSDNTQGTHQNAYNEYSKGNSKKASPFAMNWFSKLIGIVVIIVVLFAVIILGTLAIRLFFSIGVPIFMIYMIIQLFRGIFRSRH